MDGWTHRGGKGAVGDVGAFDGAWAGLGDLIGDRDEVVEKISFREGDAANAEAEVSVTVDTVGDFTTLDVGDSGFDIHGNGAGLWVWH